MAPSGHFYPSAKVGPYEIASRLGRGFVSEVWLAYHPAGDGRMQATALKRLHHRDPALHASFLEAVRRAEHMDHPNLVHVFSSFVHEGESVAVLEMVDGINLRELVRAMGARAVDQKTAVWIARECLRASFEVQVQVTGAQIDHGHLVSSNVILARDGVVRVSDFILARTTNDARLVGDLGRPAMRDAVSAARMLVGLCARVPPEEILESELLQRAAGLKRASIQAFAERCLAEDSGARLRALEEDLGRMFYAELGAHDTEDGTPAIARLVRELMPAVEAERARLDASGFLPFARDAAPAAPTIATKATFGFTQVLEARDEPVMPSPLTNRDIPTGFTRDVDLGRAGLRVPSSEVAGGPQPSGSSEASTDEDLPSQPAHVAKPSGGLRTPALPPQAHRNPPPAASTSGATTSNPGHVGATMSTEIKVGWMQKVAPVALAFSVGVAGTAVAFAYFIRPRPAESEQLLTPRPVEIPRPMVEVEAPKAAPTTDIDLEALLRQIETTPANTPARTAGFELAAGALRARIATSSLDERAKKAALGLVEEAKQAQDVAALSRALRMLTTPRRPKLAPAEEL